MHFSSSNESLGWGGCCGFSGSLLCYRGSLIADCATCLFQCPAVGQSAAADSEGPEHFAPMLTVRPCSPCVLLEKLSNPQRKTTRSLKGFDRMQVRGERIRTSAFSSSIRNLVFLLFLLYLGSASADCHAHGAASVGSGDQQPRSYGQ